MTDREIEARLRAFYRTEAGEGETAPLALRRDVVAIPRTIPERTRWFGRSRNLTLLAAAALLLVGGAMAAGSGVVKLPSVVPPEPAPSLAVVATASPVAESPSPTISPLPSPTEKGLPAQAGQFAEPCDFGLTPGGVGWVSTPAALYRTENLGRTWSVVSPRGWSAVTIGTSVYPNGTSFFADADTAYTYLPGAPGTIAVTHDGGANWTEQTIAGTTANDGASLWFQTPTSGSLIFWALSKGDPSRMFTTADGGATWTGPRPGPSIDNAGEFVWSCSHAVLQSVLVRPLTPPGDFSVANKLQVSHDAGATWVDRTLPVGPHAPASTPTAIVDKQVITAWGDGSGRIVMALEVSGGPVGGFQDQIYASTDDGRSWQYVQTPAPLHIGQNSQLLSATEWILVAYDASTVMSTTDGGATWRTVTGAVRFRINERPNNVSFASPDFGWIRPSCDPSTPDPKSSVCPTSAPGQYPPTSLVLLQTTDGGATWTPLDKQP